jgi:GDPmannose 4,6-dehydratase
MVDKPKRAMISGINGQDGSYLGELLLEEGYEVWGLLRRSSSVNLQRINHLLTGPHLDHGRLHLRYADLADVSSLQAAIDEAQPDEVYNLASQSHVKISFQMPEYTCDVTGLGPLRLLAALRDLRSDARFLQVGSSEQYGQVTEIPQKEDTPFHPRSPYACAKVLAHHLTRNYRESYGMFAVNGILFNHESPRRGETFVTRKITQAVAAIVRGRQEQLYLGNLEARRDWGFAGDYVKAMRMMMQADQPNDYVIASGESHSVREFCELAFAYVDLPLTWEGTGMSQRGIGPEGRVLVQVDPRYFRPAEVDMLLGDYSKAQRELGWQPSVGFEELVQMMVDADLKDG